MEQPVDRIKAYFKDFSKKLSRAWEGLSDAWSQRWEGIQEWTLDNKGVVLGVLVALSVIAVGSYYVYTMPQRAPNVTGRSPEEKITIPYIIANRDLSVRLDYAWIDSIGSSEWDCLNMRSPPRANLTYTVKNYGEPFDELFYLPVPDYLYPNQFETPGMFTWTNGLYLVMQDEPLPAGENRTYSFTLSMEPYQQLCKIKNEIDGYSKEIDNRHEQLSTMSLSSDKLQQVDEAYLAFTQAKQSIDGLVQTARQSDPSMTLSSLDQMNTYQLRQGAILSQQVLGNEYAFVSTQTNVQRLEQTMSAPNEQLLQQMAIQREELSSLKNQLEKQFEKPSLEDLLKAYYNTSQ